MRQAGGWHLYINLHEGLAGQGGGDKQDYSSANCCYFFFVVFPGAESKTQKEEGEADGGWVLEQNLGTISGCRRCHPAVSRGMVWGMTWDGCCPEDKPGQDQPRMLPSCPSNPASVNSSTANASSGGWGCVPGAWAA